MKFASKGHKERFLQETDKASVSYLLSVIPDLHNMTEEEISILAKQEIVLIESAVIPLALAMGI